MITKNNAFLNISSISYLREIRDLPFGYNRNSYPLYSAIIRDSMFTLDKEELDSILLCHGNLVTVSFKTGSVTFMGYPCNTGIIVHVNQKEIAFITCYDETEPLYCITFKSGSVLYCSHKDTLKILTERN